MSVPGNKDKEKVTTDTTEKPKNKIYQAKPEETMKAATQAVQETLNPAVETEKAPTIEDMLEERRKAAQAEKTDAQKMQRYYALADAMKALGKMGGAAVGGAIGGDALAGATPVEYKPNRGYLDAIEKAKKANDRLRSLDDTGFQLAVSKQQRDEERAYQDKVRADERAFKREMDKADKEWQKVMADYKAKIEQAALENNYKLKAQYEAERDEAEQKYWEKRASIEHKYNVAEKGVISANQQAQIDAYNKVPLAFDDGTAMNLTKGQQDGMRLFFMGKEIDGVVVDKDNVDAVIRANPRLAREYMRIIGGATTTQSTSASGYSAAGGATATPTFATGPHTQSALTPNGQIDSRYFNYVDPSGGATAPQTNGGSTQPSGSGGNSVENDSRIQIDW